MPTYKKSATVEAQLYTAGMEHGCEKFGPVETPELRPYLDTKNGRQFIKPGDYIITNPDGERYPCDAATFESTYELVEEAGEGEPQPVGDADTAGGVSAEGGESGESLTQGETSAPDAEPNSGTEPSAENPSTNAEGETQTSGAEGDPQPNLFDAGQPGCAG